LAVWPPWRFTYLLFLAVSVAFANGLRGGFQFDDYTVIVNNPAVHSLGAWGASMPGIRPLLKLSYTLNWVTGFGAPAFHAVNAVCHVAASLLAMRLCRHLAQASEPLAPVAGPIALTAALIFALHPVQTEAVTYISGRSVSLMAVFYLGAILAHLVFETPPRPPLRKSPLCPPLSKGGMGGFARPLLPRGLPPLLFALALATKETAATLPLVLVLVDRALGLPWKEALRRTVPHWGVLALATLAGLAMPGYARLLAFSLSLRPIGTNILSQIGGVSYLLTRPLVLLQTNIDPPLVPQTILRQALVVQACVLLILLVGGVVLLSRIPPVGAAVLWLFLHLVPTNSLLPRLDIANDRQLYLAILGPALLLAAAVWRWLPRRSAMVIVCLLSVVLAAATMIRNEDYRSEVALWSATVTASPQSARAWNNLGYALRLTGDCTGARHAYERALNLNPAQFRARWTLEALSNAECGVRNAE
jgi:hypothetical protein